MAIDAPYLGIDGDIAQNLIPFSCGDFSFRKDGFIRINICPSSIKKALVDKDISFKNIEFPDMFNMYSVNGNFFDKIIDMIPAVQIREYAQNSRIMQIMDAFRAFSAGAQTAMDYVNQQDFDWNPLKFALLNLPKHLADKFQTLTASPSGVSPEIVKGNKELASFALHIPFLLYYQICTTKNLSLYTIPYSGKMVDASNGSAGWNTAHGFAGMNTSNNSMLGTLINFFGKNIKFNTTPMWDGNTQNDYPSIEVQFDLFNDDMESSVDNFLFLNNIIPKNKFIQYHIFQHNPCLYDIKIEGYDRLYMCTGDMTCDYKGVSRYPPKKFFDEIAAMVEKEGLFGGLTADIMMNNKMVKIPDVYSFKLTFKSLLPNSLNNYLFRYSNNADLELNMFTADDMTGTVGTNLEEAMKDAQSEGKVEAYLQPYKNAVKEAQDNLDAAFENSGPNDDGLAIAEADQALKDAEI